MLLLLPDSALDVVFLCIFVDRQDPVDSNQEQQQKKNKLRSPNKQTARRYFSHALTRSPALQTHNERRPPINSKQNNEKKDKSSWTWIFLSYFSLIDFCGVKKKTTWKKEAKKSRRDGREVFNERSTRFGGRAATTPGQCTWWGSLVASSYPLYYIHYTIHL